MSPLLARYPRHALLGSLCCGLAAANLARPGAVTLLTALACLAGALAPAGPARVVVLAGGLALLGWWWGSARLERLDRSPLLEHAGYAGLADVAVSGPSRRGRFDLRVTGEVRRLGRLGLREPALLRLPLGRSPPQGAVIRVIGEVTLPRGPEDGFDEGLYLRRHGIHVVIRVSRWRTIGRRQGLGAVADRLRARIGRVLERQSDDGRRALLRGIVLGDDGALDEDLRQRFRASGLYHLLAVSGQNVALVAAGALLFAWVLGLPRWLGQAGALAAIGAYVLAVGAQPSVVRAGIAGGLASVAWLSARERDRWYFLLLGAFALLAWNPYTLLDPGFQLSFAAVAAIFVLVPPLQRFLEGYPLHCRVAGVLSVSTACGVATAPILWLHFHAVPLLAVPANAVAAPAMVPVLALSLGAVALDPLDGAAAAVLVEAAGWCAAYLALCARLIGGLPGAELRSGSAAAALAAGGLCGAAYALRRWRTS